MGVFNRSIRTLGRLEGEVYDGERAPQLTKEIVELIHRKVIDTMHFFISEEEDPHHNPRVLFTFIVHYGIQG